MNRPQALGTSGRHGLALALLLAAAPLPAQQAESPAIADNSFLIEEAYNQEPGVVQHISAFLRLRAVDSWVYTFTQEWPLRSQRNQVSLTLPLQRLRDGLSSATGLGDVALNYRYQLADAMGTLAAAPRLSLLLPTGDREAGLGAGALGLQLNLPASIAVAKQLVTHWNAGVTVIPSAKNALGGEAATTGYNLGGSVIWLVRPAFNLVVEVAWTSSETVTGPGVTARIDALLLNPGVRWAHNFFGGLQIVPGIAFPIGVGPSGGDDAVFFYLSFEHPFRKADR